MLVNPLRAFAALLVVAVGVSAQSVDSCIQGCLAGSVSADTCTDATNVTCVCTSTAFQAAVVGCLTTNCTATDLATAKALLQSECPSSNSSSTNTSSSATTPKSTASSSAATPSSSSSTKSGAVRDQVPFLNAALALGTVALGGAFFL